MNSETPVPTPSADQVQFSLSKVQIFMIGVAMGFLAAVVLLGILK